MFKKIKTLIINFFWFILPQSSNDWLHRLINVGGFVQSLFSDLFFILSPIKFFMKNFIGDLIFIVSKYWSVCWNLIVRHRLMYIVRLAFIICLLYKPTLLDLDSLYWTLATLFYFISNNIFFITSYILPFPDWSLGSPVFKLLLFFSFFPALFLSKRFKRRLLKKNKLILQDDELYLAFKWAQRIFIFTFYFLAWYISFFLLSIFIPFLYIYAFGPDVGSIAELYYVTYFNNSKYLLFISNFFFNKNFFYFTPIFLSLTIKFIYSFFSLYVFPFVIPTFFLFSFFYFKVFWLSVFIYIFYS